MDRPSIQAPTAATRVVVVVGCRPYCEALTCTLQQTPGISVVLQVSNVDSAVEALRNGDAAAEIMLVDVTFGAAAISRLWAASPDVAIVALGVSGDIDEEIVALAEAGASGFVTTQSSLSHVATVFESVLHGDLTISPTTARALQRRLAELSAASRDTPAHLTMREMEILRLVEIGLADKEIASKLSIERKTVKNHVHNVLAKLGVRRRTEAAAWLRRNDAPLPVKHRT